MVESKGKVPILALWFGLVALFVIQKNRYIAEAAAPHDQKPVTNHTPVPVSVMLLCPGWAIQTAFEPAPLVDRENTSKLLEDLTVKESHEIVPDIYI